MKKIIYLFTLIFLFNSCKKEEITPTASTKKDPVVQTTTYQVTVTTGAYNFTGDTLLIKKNGVLIVPAKYGVYVDNVFGFIAKTGDKISVHYNPGTVIDNNHVIIDDNDLTVFLDHDKINGPILEEGCRCTTNFEYILQ